MVEMGYGVIVIPKLKYCIVLVCVPFFFTFPMFCFVFCLPFACLFKISYGIILKDGARKIF